MQEKPVRISLIRWRLNNGIMFIRKIKLHNYRRFKDIEIPFKEGRNILVGDNESGKSSVLEAIDLTARGSRHRVEDIGIATLFNVDVIREFMDSDRQLTNLPELYVELYLGNTVEEGLYGNINSDGVVTYGIRMLFEPDLLLSRQTYAVLQASNASFPFEFYTISYTTFSGEAYNGYTKKLKTILLDNNTIGNEYALNDFISTIYAATLDPVEQLTTKHSYGTSKVLFKDSALTPFDNKLPDGYSFAVKNTGKNCLENDLTIQLDGVPITEKGTGIQCVVKTQLALKRTHDIPVIMLEEPENHLSHLNMRKMIDDIERNNQAQIFISTHSDLISTRLDLRNCILMNSATPMRTTAMNFISEDTAKFFMKAPDNNMLQFVLANKVILVEGDAEFIMMDAFCRRVLNHSLSEQGIDVISVDGKSFKRYLEIAKVLKMRVAVITDNDGNYDENITAAYQGYMDNEFDNIKIYSELDNERYTFEVAIYRDNQTACDELFEDARRTLSVLKYMLANKAEAAYKLLTEKSDTIVTPQYIKKALEWVSV